MVPDLVRSEGSPEWSLPRTNWATGCDNNCTVRCSVMHTVGARAPWAQGNLSLGLLLGGPGLVGVMANKS